MRAVALCGLLAAIIWMPFGAYAQAKLQLYPTGVTLTEGKNSAEFSVINAGTATGRYRIELADMMMPEEGALQKVEEGVTLEHSLVPYARITPRSVEVPPSQSQKFRLLLRLPRDLADGEYRTHAHILMTSTDVEAESEPSAEGFGVKLQPRFRVSVPVVYLKGETWFRSTLDHLELQPTEPGRPPVLGMHFTNEGNRSARGRLVVTLERNGDRHELYRLNGFTIYRETNSRSHAAPLKLPNGMELQTGDVLSVTYTETEADDGELITQKTLQL